MNGQGKQVRYLHNNERDTQHLKNLISSEDHAAKE